MRSVPQRRRPSCQRVKFDWSPRQSPPPCPPAGGSVVMFTHTGHAGTGAPPDDGDAPVNCAPPAELALSSDVAPVIASGPGVVGGLSQGSVDSYPAPISWPALGVATGARLTVP